MKGVVPRALSSGVAHALECGAHEERPGITWGSQPRLDVKALGEWGAPLSGGFFHKLYCDSSFAPFKTKAESPIDHGLTTGGNKSTEKELHEKYCHLSESHSSCRRDVDTNAIEASFAKGIFPVKSRERSYELKTIPKHSWHARRALQSLAKEFGYLYRRSE